MTDIPPEVLKWAKETEATAWLFEDADLIQRIGLIGVGFALAQMIIALDTAESEPEPPPPPEPEPRRVQINTSVLNVRKGPGTTYAIVRTVSEGSVFEVLEVSGDWLRIGETDWIHGGYVVEWAEPS